MNERIKLLAEQTGLKVESFMTNPPKPFQILGSTEQFEKFAELIVQECMNAVCDPSTTYLESMTDASAMYTARERIRKHFRS